MKEDNNNNDEEEKESQEAQGQWECRVSEGSEPTVHVPTGKRFD